MTTTTTTTTTATLVPVLPLPLMTSNIRWQICVRWWVGFGNLQYFLVWHGGDVTSVSRRHYLPEKWRKILGSVGGCSKVGKAPLVLSRQRNNTFGLFSFPRNLPPRIQISCTTSKGNRCLPTRGVKRPKRKSSNVREPSATSMSCWTRASIPNVVDPTCGNGFCRGRFFRTRYHVSGNPQSHRAVVHVSCHILHLLPSPQYHRNRTNAHSKRFNSGTVFVMVVDSHVAETQPPSGSSMVMMINGWRLVPRSTRRLNKNAKGKIPISLVDTNIQDCKACSKILTEGLSW